MSEKRWNVIYPIYITSKKTIAEGRRVPANIAVDNPTAIEIADVCRYLGFEVVVEADAAYSRDYTMRGRVRLRMKDDSGKPLKPEYTTKKQIYAKLCELIPKLQSRVSKSTQAQVPASGKGGKKGKGKK